MSYILNQDPGKKNRIIGRNQQRFYINEYYKYPNLTKGHCAYNKVLVSKVLAPLQEILIPALERKYSCVMFCALWFL